MFVLYFDYICPYNMSFPSLCYKYRFSAALT